MATKRSRWKAALLSRFVRGRSFARDQRGVTAIEFGLLGIPFFAIMGAILETALIFIADQTLDSAVQDAARLIRTGQAGQAGYDAAAFKASVCKNLYNLFDCTQLKIHTSVVGTFSGASTSSPIDATTGAWNTAWLNDTYDGGTKSAVIMVEAYYKWPLVVNFGGFSLRNTADGKRLLASVRVFKNEPF